jgi:hypothetical protein
MVPDAASSLGIIIGLGAESTGFVATSRVIANVIPPSPPLEKGGEGGFDNDITAEIASSTLFFGALRVFGAAGQFAQRLLPMTETGLAASKSFGHFSSVMGLAVTEEIQAGMGNAMAANSKEAFYTRLWRALFLHVTIHTVNGITGPRNMNNEIDRPSLNTGPFAERLKEMLTAPKMTATNGYEFRVPFSFAFEGNGKPPQNGQTTPAPSDPDIIEAKVGRPFQLPPDVPGELPSGLVARKADPDKFAEELDRKAAAEQNEGRMGQKRPKGAPPLQVRHPYQRRESSWRNWNRPHRKRSQERTCKAPRR